MGRVFNLRNNWESILFLLGRRGRGKLYISEKEAVKVLNQIKSGKSVEVDDSAVCFYFLKNQESWQRRRRDNSICSEEGECTGVLELY